MRPRRVARTLLVATTLVPLTLVTAGPGLAAPIAPAAPPAASADTPAAAIPRPHNDPFYRYTGSTPLRDVAPGTVLKKRTVSLSLAGKLTTPVQAEQLLYRTRDERRRPSVTVTTVVAPLGAVTGVVGYLSFYDALGDLCDPSYTLRGGYPGTDTNAKQANIEEALIASLAAQGYAVTVPDFEGEDLHWVAGHESGWSTLDAVRATESYLGKPASTKVGLFGYSGGSIAGEWATELAPRYSPELNLVGTAIGGIPVDLAHNLRYVDGSTTWSGVIPAALVALGRAFGVDLGKYESAYGHKLTRQVSDECIGSFNGAYPGLKVAKLLKPRYHDFLHIPAITRIVNKLIMGSVPGHPKVPMMMAVGDADGTGDGVMIVKDVQALAHQYCRQGVNVTLQVVEHAEHTQAGIAFFPLGEAYLLQRMAGVPATSGCAQIPAGNSLAPIRRKISPTIHVTSRRHRDVITVRTAHAIGARVKFYRVHRGHKVVIAEGVIGSSGQVRKAVRDHNGHRRTRYQAHLSGTSKTLPGTTRVVRHR